MTAHIWDIHANHDADGAVQAVRPLLISILREVEPDSVGSAEEHLIVNIS